MQDGKDDGLIWELIY